MSSTIEKRRIIRRRRLRRERNLLRVIREQTKIATIRISTVKVIKPKISPREGLAILIGTQIGAGVLGLPYAASRVGLVLSIGILIGVMLLMLVTSLIVLRLSAEMGGAQMSTMACKTLGKIGGWIMYLSIMVMSFGALLAYVAGMGSVLFSLLGIDEVYGSILFWVLASAVVYSGIEASGKVELLMSYVMFILFIGVSTFLLPNARLENGYYFEIGGTISMIGISIFALGCHTVIPEVYRGIGDYEKTKKVVILAFLIPTMIYALFMLSFLLAFGKDTPQIATQGLEILYGRFGLAVGNSIPIVAITTSYIGIGLAQQGNNIEFVKLKKPIAWMVTVVPPLSVYLLGIKNFAEILAFAGDTGDLMAFIILPLTMWIVKRYKDKNYIKTLDICPNHGN